MTELYGKKEITQNNYDKPKDRLGFQTALAFSKSQHAVARLYPKLLTNHAK